MKRTYYFRKEASDIASLASVIDRLDKLPEFLVMRAMNRLYDSGGRGIFNSKFIKYEQMRELGYAGFRALVQNICELNEDFIKRNMSELIMLADLTERLLSNPEPEPQPEPAVPANLLQGEQYDDRQLDNWNRDPYS